MAAILHTGCATSCACYALSGLQFLSSLRGFPPGSTCACSSGGVIMYDSPSVLLQNNVLVL